MAKKNPTKKKLKKAKALQHAKPLTVKFFKSIG
jgi:hypothetical protein